jgi:hypothetical protein
VDVSLWSGTLQSADATPAPVIGRRDRAFNRQEVLCPHRNLGIGLPTFLVLLGFPAVPQEPAGKGADTESGQLFACELRRGGHAARPSVQDRGRGDVTQSLRWQELRRSSTDPEMIRLRPNLATPSLPQEFREWMMTSRQ